MTPDFVKPHFALCCCPKLNPQESKSIDMLITSRLLVSLLLNSKLPLFFLSKNVFQTTAVRGILKSIDSLLCLPSIHIGL